MVKYLISGNKSGLGKYLFDNLPILLIESKAKFTLFSANALNLVLFVFSICYLEEVIMQYFKFFSKKI